MNAQKGKKKRSKKSWGLSSSRTWLAMGTIAAYAATGGTGGVSVATAQNTNDQPSPKAQLPVWRFDIAAGPLDETLEQFARICGLSVRYTIPKDTIPGFKSNGVSGLYTQRQALKQILEGTGLGFSFSGQDAVSIGIDHLQASVNVTASSLNSVALGRFPAPLVDTPQSITAIPKKTLADQGVTTLRDALRDAPGISLAAGEGGSQGDNLTIRGFTAQNDIFLDGMRDFGSYYRDPFNYEQVDVLEGPAGVEFGRGSTGGIINQESKAPKLVPAITTDGALGTDLTRRFTADIDEPLPRLAKGAAFRLNVMGHDSDVSQRDVVTNRRYGVAPTFAIGLDTPTRLTASYFHFGEDDIPDYGFPWYFGRPAPVDRHNYYGFSHLNFLRTNVNLGTVKAEHDLGGYGVLRNVVRFANYERKWQITEPQVNNASAGIITPQTPLDQVMVNRNQLAGHSAEGSAWDQADITLSGKFLGIHHIGILGAEGGKETSDPTRLNYNDAQGINTVPRTHLLNPDESQPFSGIATLRSNAYTSAYSIGLYLLDTFELSRQWELSGGIRWDRFHANYSETVANVHFTQLVKKPTWRGALVYKPKANGSIYFDYGTSFNPSAEALSLTLATSATPPEENETFELGSKWELNRSRLALRGDLFRTNKQNAREPDPNDSSIDVLSGNQRVDGAEFVIQGHPADRWELLSSYTFMHPEVVSSIAYPFAVGRPLNNVPANLFNLWSEYRLPRGFEVGGGGNFVDSRTANTATLTPTTIVERAPGYWTFSGMAKYEVTERIALQVNVSNIGDRFFLDELHPGHVIPGAGTSALLGMKFKF